MHSITQSLRMLWEFITRMAMLRRYPSSMARKACLPPPMLLHTLPPRMYHGQYCPLHVQLCSNIHSSCRHNEVSRSAMRVPRMLLAGSTHSSHLLSSHLEKCNQAQRLTLRYAPCSWESYPTSGWREAIRSHVRCLGKSALLTYSRKTPSDFDHVVLMWVHCVLQVIWTQGSTQGGSSGSPLIDTATKRVVGVLTGGVSTCDTRGSPDYFGRISRVSSASPKAVCEPMRDLAQSQRPRPRRFGLARGQSCTAPCIVLLLLSHLLTDVLDCW